MRRPRGRSGLTLLELILVLFLLGVALALAAPALNTGMGASRVRQAARELRAAMEYQRLQALREGREQVLVVDPENNSYRLGREGKVVPVPPEKGVLEARGRWRDREGRVWFYFYPDGLTSGGEVVVERKQGLTRIRYRVFLDPLLGTASVSEVEPSP